MTQETFSLYIFRSIRSTVDYKISILATTPTLHFYVVF